MCGYSGFLTFGTNHMDITFKQIVSRAKFVLFKNLKQVLQTFVPFYLEFWSVTVMKECQ